MIQMIAVGSQLGSLASDLLLTSGMLRELLRKSGSAGPVLHLRNLPSLLKPCPQRAVRGSVSYKAEWTFVAPSQNPSRS